jgi:hypothetical protein
VNLSDPHLKGINEGDNRSLGVRRRTTFINQGRRYSRTRLHIKMNQKPLSHACCFQSQTLILRSDDSDYTKTKLTITISDVNFRLYSMDE